MTNSEQNMDTKFKDGGFTKSENDTLSSLITYVERSRGTREIGQKMDDCSTKIQFEKNENLKIMWKVVVFVLISCLVMNTFLLYIKTN
jgi:hypothetical protein